MQVTLMDQRVIKDAVHAVQSNLNYLDLDYPDFLIIQTFSPKPILS